MKSAKILKPKVVRAHIRIRVKRVETVGPYLRLYPSSIKSTTSKKPRVSVKKAKKVHKEITYNSPYRDIKRLIPKGLPIPRLGWYASYPKLRSLSKPSTRRRSELV